MVGAGALVDMMDQVFEAMVDVVLVVGADGQIKMANTAAEGVTGYTRADLECLPVAQLLNDEHSGVRTEVRQRVADGAVLRREDSWLVTKAGSRIPVSVTAAPVVNAHGAAAGIVVVLRDTSELRQLLAARDQEISRRESAELELKQGLASIEHRLEESRSQLMLAERRATLGTLAGGVGHELRNIGQIHVTAVETVTFELEALGMNDALREALADLERVGEHIAVHARRLMQLAKPGPDHATPININRAIQDVVGMLQGAGKLRQIKVVFALDDRALFVTVNKTRIEQILVNLIVNAADAIGASAGQIMVAVLPNDERVFVEVSDTGEGIPPEVLPRIFDAFFTTKLKDQGTGLGLPVVREIVESYGGQLRVRSEVGVGTTFTFDLPMSTRGHGNHV